ncbi:MAG: type II secretion system GspH family protein [Candidatus Peribacteria bacterium]|nr:type II secretion system GspH family protein [Candidatus Peribacteria bacterium]
MRSGQPKQSFTKLFSQKQKKTKAFTLIELLVVITIIFMLMMTVYAPYSLYQQKAKLKLASRELSQSFYEAKNMAVSGIKEQRIDEEDYTTENMAV